MFDAKAWIEPAMEGLHNIIYPHCSEIFSGEDGRKKLTVQEVVLFGFLKLKME